ncbi:MAG: hypothetical protein WA061_02645 [Microgenomates group bacterium]
MNDISKTNNTTILQNMDDVERAAKAMTQSGFFKDTSQLAQAMVKILAGQEIGIGAFASMSGIHIIQGKPTYGANIIAAKVKASGKYDYVVEEMTDKVCRLSFLQDGRKIGESAFTIEDAKKAGTQNLNKFPRNMLFARAISNGQKWFCPDVTFVTMYTPEDFGAYSDDNGNVIEGVDVTDESESKNTTPQIPSVVPPVESPAKPKYSELNEKVYAFAMEKLSIDKLETKKLVKKYTETGNPHNIDTDDKLNALYEDLKSIVAEVKAETRNEQA